MDRDLFESSTLSFSSTNLFALLSFLPRKSYKTMQVITLHMFRRSEILGVLFNKGKAKEEKLSTKMPHQRLTSTAQFWLVARLLLFSADELHLEADLLFLGVDHSQHSACSLWWSSVVCLPQLTAPLSRSALATLFFQSVLLNNRKKSKWPNKVKSYSLVHV